MNDIKIVKVIKGLAHIKRYTFFKMIQNNPGINQTIIIRQTNTLQTAACFHLQKLEQSGLIYSKRKLLNILYFPNNELIEKMAKLKIFK